MPTRPLPKVKFLLTTMVALIAGGALGAEAAAADATRPPNVILVVADDLGWGDLACYGNRSINTPHLDGMAAEGVRYTQAYAGSTVCTPSRAVLMNGLHTGHAYQRGNDGKDMRPQDVTVAEVLKGAGYATGLVGKWGLGSPGTAGVATKQGFDVFYGYLTNHHAHNYYPAFLFRGERREPLPNEVPNGNKDGRGVATKKVAYSNDLFIDEALKFVDAHTDKTFFLYLPFTTPHANNEARQEGMEVPDLGDYAWHADWPPQRKGHAAMVSRLDGYMGKLFAHLKTLGLDVDTLVIFTSDNGPHAEGGYQPEMNDSNGPLRGAKRDLYEGGIRVPFIVRWPGRARAGRTSEEVVWGADVMPTLGEVAKVDPAKLPKHDGVSITPTFLPDTPAPLKRDPLYWEFYERGSRQAVRDGDWKAIRQPMFTGKTELYDLKSDVSETTDVAAQHPEVVKRLETIMQSAHTPPENPSERERAVVGG